MLNDVMESKHLKQNMLEASKHKASQAHCTTAMQYMNHMAKTTQNSPRACQNKPKTCMEYSQNKLAWRHEAWSMLGQQRGLHYIYQHQAWDDFTNKNQIFIMAK